MQAENSLIVVVEAVVVAGLVFLPVRGIGLGALAFGVAGGLLNALIIGRHNRQSHQAL